MFPTSHFKTIAARAAILTVAVLLALGAQAGTAIAAALDVGLAAPPRSTQEENEERGHVYEKAGVADRRGREGLGVPGRATLVARTRVPIPAIAPRTALVRGVLPDHESDYRSGLGAPLLC